MVQPVSETRFACGALKAELQRAEMGDGICVLLAERPGMLQGVRVGTGTAGGCKEGSGGFPPIMLGGAEKVDEVGHSLGS